MTEMEQKFFESSRHYAAALRVLNIDVSGITALMSNLVGKIDEKDIVALAESQNDVARLFMSFANEIRGVGKTIHDKFDPDCHCMNGYKSAEEAVSVIEAKMPSTPEELEAKEKRKVEINVISLDDPTIPSEVRDVIDKIQGALNKPKEPKP